MTFSSMAVIPSSVIAQSVRNYYAAEEKRDVFESHRQHIFSVAYYMTGDEREAETILTSTFVQSFQQQARPSIQQLDRTLMGELRSRFSLAPVPAIEASGVSLGAQNVRRTDLEEALWQLPARERLCFLLRDVEGYTPARIAGLLETSQVEVQRTLLSARLRLRSLLVEQRSSTGA